jgi:cysteinyl-tRNA synthetase
MDPHADAMRVLFKPGDVAEMRRRTGAPDKTLLAYMSIGEAEDYRFYWDPQWVRKQGGRTVLTSKAPKWLAAENNEGWSGNFKVRYWDPAWQNVIVGEGMFLDRILAAGFDGVYLDIIDGFEYFADRRTAQDEMVDFVTRICRSARARKPGFLIVPQNGEQLLAKKRYRDVISAIGKEDILYDQRKNSSRHVVDRQPRDYIAGTTEDLKHALADRIPVLSVEYLMDDAANRALIPKVEAEVRGLGYIPYFADRKLAVLHPTRHPPDLAPPAVA